MLWCSQNYWFSTKCIVALFTELLVLTKKYSIILLIIFVGRSEYREWFGFDQMRLWLSFGPDQLFRGIVQLMNGFQVQVWFDISYNSCWENWLSNMTQFWPNGPRNIILGTITYLVALFMVLLVFTNKYSLLLLIIVVVIIV